jgi:hypothetical protein
MGTIGLEGTPRAWGEPAAVTLARRGLALVLACSLYALVVFSAAHVHGLSDPHEGHHAGDYLLERQAQAGFLAAPLVVLVVACLVRRPVRPAQPTWVPAYTGRPYACRAPPAGQAAP